MGEGLKFEGRPRLATDSDVDLAFLVIEYCNQRFGMKPSDLYKLESKLERNEFNSLQSRKTKRHYESLSRALFTFLTYQVHDKTYPRLDEIHDWMHGPIGRLFPEIKDYFQNEAPLHFHERLTAAATKDDDAKAKVIECFGGERYVYRYARNADEDEIRIAKGRLSVPEAPDGSPFLPFTVDYRAAPRRTGGIARNNRITGNILLINSHFMFIGVEDGSKNAFFMVIRYAGPHDIYGALILRKHLDRGFMATKGLVSALPAHDAEIGTREIADVPEMTPDLHELLINIGNHQGRGPLILPDV